MPTIVKIFASNDRAIRVCLLQHIDQYGESLSAQIVDEQVYPRVATGFSDTSAFLRELTLNSMLVISPKLSQRTISGSLLKYLSKLQVDEEPVIRTNTTILLGNIASYLNEGTRKRVLINAFTACALRDTFSPARGAGILEVNSGDTTGAVGLGMPSIPANASLLGWAMSSLTLKGKPSEQASATLSAPLTSTSSNASSVMDTPSTAPVHEHSTSDFADQPVPESPTSTDGWGELENGIDEANEPDKDGWDDIEPVEEPKPSPACVNIQAAQKRSVSQPALQPKQVASSHPKITAKITKHDDDDLWDSVAAPAPRTASKPLNVKRAGTARDDDLWNAIAAPAPVTRVQPLAAGRGRAKPVSQSLGAQRKNRTS